MPPKKKLKPMPGNQTIVQLFGGSAATEKSSTPENATEKPKPVKPIFQQKWLNEYHWLEFDDEKKLMFCKLCRELKFENALAVGTNNFKTTTLTRHTDHKEHKQALIAPKCRQSFEAAVAAVDTKELEGILACMTCVFWLSKEEIPLSKYESLMNLLTRLKTPYIQDVKVGARTTYQSYKSAVGFLEAISQCIDMRVTEEVKKSPVVTILTDESTDIVIHHKLCISARVVDPITLAPKTLFLTDLRLTSATGEGIYEAIKSHLSSRGIEMSRVSGKFVHLLFLAYPSGYDN